MNNYYLIPIKSLFRKVNIKQNLLKNNCGNLKDRCLRVYTNKVSLNTIDFHQDDDPKLIAAAYHEHGCCVVRGLNQKFVDQIRNDVLTLREQTLKLFEQSIKIPEGKMTPDGTLLVPSSNNDQYQIMVLGLDYYASSALFRVSIDEKVLDIVQAILGDPNIELYGKGQVLLKEPQGGLPKHPHQDAAYFEFANAGPVGTLNYCVCTTKKKNNGSLVVWPGSHKRGYVEHFDTESHLGLPANQWELKNGLMIDGEAGDCIFFHQYCVHASPKNLSNEPRPTFINRYLQCDDYPIMPLATSVKMRKAALEKAKYEKPRKDIGYMVRGRKIYNPKIVENNLLRQKQFH